MISIRLRLLLGAVVGIALALSLAGFVLVGIFQAHIHKRFVKELEDHLVQLIAAVEIDESGKATIKRELSEPEFVRPVSGYYWQIEQNDLMLRSRSLWDGKLKLPEPAPLPGDFRAGTASGPNGENLVLVERAIDPQAASGATLRIAVGADSGAIDSARREFAGVVATSLAILGLLLAAATWLQVGAGLKPLDALGGRLDAVRMGAAKRVEGEYPGEVAGLVSALNRLIDTQDEETERARGNAAKLGHGLKTPLAVLAAESRVLRDRGQAASADTITDAVSSMNAHVVRTLASARAVGARGALGARTAVAPALEQLVAAMRKLARDGGPTFHLDIDDRSVAVRVDRRDIDDMLGNLIDNSRKWAKSKVHVSVRRRADQVLVTVADDGPGIPEEKFEDVLAFGTRLDLTVPGTGVGLSIVKDLVELNDGRLSLATREGGGLEAVLVLPAAPGGASARK